MGLFHSPSIVRDGLVLCLDAANPKSYPGSGTTLFDLSSNKYNATSTALSIATLSNIGKVIDFNTSSVLTSTLSTPINHESWSLIYWVRSTGLPISDYRSVIRLVEPNGSHGYFYNVDTRQITNTYILGYQKDFSINNWLTYGHMNQTQWTSQDWWCLGVSHNNKTFKHYTNGVWVNTQNQALDVSGYGDINLLKINSSGSNTVYMGPVQFYGEVLTDDQFKQNFAAHRGRYGL